MAAQDQYTEMIKKNQDAMKSAFDNWTRTVQESFGKLPTVAPADANQVIDQVFEFSTQLLTAQRDFAKQLVATSNEAAADVQEATAKATKDAAANS